MTASSSLHDARPALRLSLAAAGEALRVPLSERQSTQLLDFIDLLARWNRTYNLTAVRDPASMLTQHVVDCLAVVPALRRQDCRGRFLDAGSGGGLPGVVWAVVEPDWDVMCVDSVGKKASFLQQAAATLKLGNLHGEHARVETLSPGGFDLIASRAFAALPDFVAMTQSLLAKRGVWLAMKGKVPTAEMSALASDIDVFHVEPVQVPGLDADRCLVWMRPHPDHRAGKDSRYEKSVHSHSSSSDVAP